MKIIRNLILVLLIPALFQACVTQKKVERYLNEHPAVSSLYCATKYPVKDSIAPPIIKYIPANNKDLTKAFDSLARDNSSLKDDIDSLSELSKTDSSALGEKYRKTITGLNKKLVSYINQIQKLKDEYKKCTPDTVFTTNTVYKRDTAKEKYLETKVSAADEKANNQKRWKNIGFIISGVLGAALILVLIFKR